jgi:hypothetical protein
VSRSKFASVTAELLSRKGQAKPWLPPEAGLRAVPPHIMALDEEDEPVGEEPHPAAHEPPTDKQVRRCSLRLTPCEYQRLGIIAVKRNSTRQRILRQAIEEYLAGIELEYGEACGCLAGHDCTSELWTSRTPRTQSS